MFSFLDEQSQGRWRYKISAKQMGRHNLKLDISGKILQF
jgi:hypothetical protein